MYILILILIYLSFACIGTPDAAIGAIWPVMRLEFGSPTDYAGYISMLLTGSKVLSCLFAPKISRRLGTSVAIAGSLIMLSLAMLGWSLSEGFLATCLCAIPMGFASGLIDTSGNNYISLHYSSRAMNLLHCAWGMGAIFSPLIIAVFLANDNWRGGYLCLFIIMVSVLAILLISLPAWRKHDSTLAVQEESSSGSQGSPLSFSQRLRIPGVPYAMLIFFCYCAGEVTVSLWASSYLVEAKGLDADIAARFSSLLFIGITASRFICSFISDRIGDNRLVKISSVCMAAGSLLLILPFKSIVFAIAGLVIYGLGCGPVFPMMIHSTPARFGRENSGEIIGMQMASSNVGSAVLPTVFGLLTGFTGIGLFPFYVFFFAALMLACVIRLNHIKP